MVSSRASSMQKFFLGAALAMGGTACNKGTGGSNASVADGTVDQGGEFGGTFYAEITTFVQGRPAATIRNVGSLVDVGSPTHKVLILSLADSLLGGKPMGSDGSPYLPVMDSLSLKLFRDDAALTTPTLELRDLAMTETGVVVDGSKNKYAMVLVGGKIERVPNTYVSRLVENKVIDVGQRIVVPGDLVHRGVNLRNIATSYVMLAVPNTVLGQVAAPLLTVADARATEDQLAKGELKMVGYGSTSKSGEGSPSVEANTKRNAATVTPLNIDPKGETPLRRFLSDSPAIAKEIWEVRGSGTCGSPDGRNYDTGASVYHRATPGSGSWSVVGFVPRSSSVSGGYRGPADCAKAAANDLASLVVSPTAAHIAAIRAMIGN